MILDPKSLSRIAVSSIILIILSLVVYISVTKNILENLSIISIVILLIFYLKINHPSYAGLILHAIMLFSVGLIPIGYLMPYLLLSLFMSISFILYVFAFSNTLTIDINKWPTSSLIILITSFLGFILAFINIRVTITSILLLSAILVVGSIIYLGLNRGIQVIKSFQVSMLEGERVEKDILFSNKLIIPIHIITNVRNGNGVSIKIPRIRVEPGETVRIPVIIDASETGIYDIYLDFFIEDIFHLTRLYKSVKATIKIMPKIKTALLAAHKLLARIPSEILEHADTKSIGEVELVPKILSSRRGEYYGARQYVPGDDLSQIHWKKSLSKGILISKEMKKTHSYSIAILVDLTSSSNRDFTEILYKTLTSLILISLKDPLRVVTLALYDMENIYLVVRNYSAAKALNSLTKIVEEGGIGTHRVYKKVLDKPMILPILSSNNEKLKALYEVLVDSIREKYVWKIIAEVLRGFEGRNIQIIHGQSSISDLYYYVKLLLRKKGYILEEPVEISPRSLYEKAVTEPIGLLAH